MLELERGKKLSYDLMDLNFMSLDTSEKNDDGPKKVFENIVS